jgi:hypothetical protein
MRPTHQLWLAARSTVLPPDCTPEVEKDLRRVFFLGALCLRQTQQHYALLGPADQAQLEQSVDAELKVFHATVGTPLEGMV